MGTGQSPGHQAGPVGLADRGGGVALRKAQALLRQRVDMRRTQHRVAVAAEVVGPLLIGDKEQEVGRLGRHRLAQTHQVKMRLIKVSRP